jgi:hypothetical protein
MKPFHHFFPFMLLAIALLFTVTASASAPKKPAPPPDLRKLIQSVDVKNSTVVIRSMRYKEDHPYKIDDFTVLTVNNVSGKLADVKPGMVVEDYLERGTDTLDSLTLSGYGTVPAAKPAAKPAPPKPKPTPKPTPSAVQTPAPAQN